MKYLLYKMEYKSLNYSTIKTEYFKHPYWKSNCKRIYFTKEGKDEGNYIFIQEFMEHSYKKEYIKVKEEYFYKGKLHRDDGPAVIKYDLNNGKLYSEEYYFNGRNINFNGPNIIYYSASVNKKTKEISFKQHKQYRFMYGNLNEKQFERIRNVFLRKINSIKKKKLLPLINSTELIQNGNDVCNLVCNFIY